MSTTRWPAATLAIRARLRHPSDTPSELAARMGVQPAAVRKALRTVPPHVVAAEYLQTLGYQVAFLYDEGTTPKTAMVLHKGTISPSWLRVRIIPKQCAKSQFTVPSTPRRKTVDMVLYVFPGGEVMLRGAAEY